MKNRHLRLFITFSVAALLASQFAHAEAVDISPSRTDVKGKVAARFGKPNIDETESGSRVLSLNGSAQPGTIIVLKGERSKLVPNSGKFHLRVKVPHGASRLQIQAVSPRGERSIYAFDVPKAGPSKAELEEMKKQEEEARLEKEKLAQEEALKSEEVKKAEEQKIAEERAAAVKEKKKKKKSPYPGLTNELVAKISMLFGTQSSLVANGRLRLWPDDLLGINSGLLTKQRWGLGANYSQTFSGSVEYSLTEVPTIYYRLVPGQVNRESVLAVGPAYSSFTHSGFAWAGMTANAYYGVPMPAFLDSLINWLPFFDVPKYMEFEASYAVSTTSTDVTSGGIYTIDWRAKAFFSNRIFGDGSLYYRNQSLTKTGVGTRSLTVIGICFGLGILF